MKGRRLAAGAALGLGLGLGLGLLLGAADISAQPAPPPSAGATGAPQPGAITASCTEHVPKGAPRPELRATLPARGISGYEARLEVVLEHAPGETVLPEGFHVQRDSDAAKAIERAGFVIPDPDGGAPPRIETRRGESKSTTTLSLPFVPLPKEAGRHELVLPPIPIAVARANGEVMTLCTEPKPITVEDPIANEAEPKVRPNPPPRPQRETWQTAKQVFYGGLAALLVAALLSWLVHRWLSRPKVVPPVPRPLPWIAAMTELEAIRRSSLLAEQRHDEHFDRVNECVRRYLGERYGFDGLESTTDEIRRLLSRVRPRPAELERIVGYLEDSDLVKFADLEPSREDCVGGWERAERIVRVTTPAPTRPRTSEPAPAATTTGRAA